MFRKLVAVELLKIRRSLALLMMFAIPMVVVGLHFLILIKQNSMAQIGPTSWHNYWTGVTGVWSYFMLPLYIALVTGLLTVAVSMVGLGLATARRPLLLAGLAGAVGRAAVLPT
ncbi:MAG: hypothetical protein WKG03_19995, partial [Telluria sp.]